LQDSDGYLWFGSEGGLTQYQRNLYPPRAQIASITSDKTYSDLSRIPSFNIGTRLTIEYGSIDLKTIPEKRQYRCRVYESKNSDKVGYNTPTKKVTFDWIPKDYGAYTFQMQAIDRDLNYSEPTSLEININPPPFYRRMGFIVGAIAVAFLIPTLILGSVIMFQRRQKFETISNPYIVGNPIRSKEMFFGRESDFDFVRAKLGQGQSGLVMVFAGARRSGKTSILFQILNGRLGQQFVSVLLDMQAMTVDSEAEFFERITMNINTVLEERIELSPGARG